MTFGGLEALTLIDYPGKVACMLYTIGCNFRCPYCHNPELVDETVEVRIGEEEALAFLDSRRHLLDGVVITGGEPTMHEELPRMIADIKARGFLVKLDTNGTNPAMLRALLGAKLLDYVAMDVKAPLSSYSPTVGSAVDTDAIRESIRLLMKGPAEYEFRTTVVKSQLSLADLEEIGREIAGAKRYYLQKFIPKKILNPQFRRKTTYSDEEFERFRNVMQRYVEHCAIR